MLTKFIYNFQGWPGYVPGYIPIKPSGLGFLHKKPVFFLLKVVFLMKLYIILYDNHYYTFEVATG